MFALWAGRLLLAACCVAPVAGMLISLLDQRRVSAELVHVPRPGYLLLYSLTVSTIATSGALILAIAPAALLGRASRCRWRRIVLTGLVIAPLLVPPQVYAYAWSLATAPHRLLAAALPPVSGVSALGSAVRAGLISAGWLWPIIALVLAAGWRASGQDAYMLALLDTSPPRAFLRAVLPSLRSYLLAAAGLVCTITMVEYPIPHLSLARTYATELLLLVDVGAPPGQIVRTCLPAIFVVLVLISIIWLATSRMGRWGAIDEEAIGIATFRTSPLWARLLFAAVWIVSMAVPLLVMIASLRIASAWRQAFTLFAREWLTSVGVSMMAGVVGVLFAVATVVHAGARRSKWRANLGWLAVLTAVIPAAALGIGFITIYNRPGLPGELYAESPVVWIFALSARYGVIPLLIAWLALRNRTIIAVQQAHADGADDRAVVSEILLPMVWPALLTGGGVVSLLALSEVVISQLVAPIGFGATGNPSIALAILNLMHYGRDDTVIIASLLIVGVGMLMAQAGAWLLLRRP